MITDGAAPGHAQRFFHHRAHAALVDVAHGEDARCRHDAHFPSPPHQCRECRPAHSSPASPSARSRRYSPVRAGPQSHDAPPAACHARCRSARVSGVLMSVCASIQIKPIRLILPAIKLRHTRHRPRGHRMIAAQRERNLPCLQRLDDQLGVLGAGRRDFLQVLRVRVAFLLLLGDSNRNVAAVLHLVAERLQTCSPVRRRARPTDPYRRRGATGPGQAERRSHEFCGQSETGCS